MSDLTDGFSETQIANYNTDFSLSKLLEGVSLPGTYREIFFFYTLKNLI